MFGKALKYDLKAIAKLFVLGAILSLMGGIGGGLLFRLFIHVSDSDTDSLVLNLSAIFSFFAGIFCLLAILLSYLLTKILVYVRFYRHFFTDEGYLTFTLPIKRSVLFLSKNVSALIWSVAQVAVTAVSILLFAILVTPPRAGGFPINPAVLRGIGDFLASAWSAVGAWLIVYLLEAILIGIVYLVFSSLLIYFCITVGAMLVKRAKLLLSIGIYYAINSVLGTAFELLLLFGGSLVFNGLHVLTDGAPKHQLHAAYALLSLAVFAGFSALTAVLYSISQHLIDRKLNLT